MKKTFLFVLAFALAFNIPVAAQAAWSTLTTIHKAQANKDMSEDKLEDISNQINSLYSLYGSNASDESSAQSGIENDESAESLHTRENLTAAVSSAYESLRIGDKIPKPWKLYVSDLTSQMSAYAPPTADEETCEAGNLINLFILGTVASRLSTSTASADDYLPIDTLYTMITSGDNTYADTLLLFLGNGDLDAGKESVNEFCKEHGYSSTHMGKVRNTTTAVDVGRFLKDVCEGANPLAATSIWTNDPTDTKLDNCEILLDILKNVGTDGLATLSGEENASAFEIGEEAISFGKAAIIFDSENKPALIVVCLVNTKSADGRYESFCMQIAADHICSALL